MYRGAKGRTWLGRTCLVLLCGRAALVWHFAWARSRAACLGHGSLCALPRHMPACLHWHCHCSCSYFCLLLPPTPSKAAWRGCACPAACQQCRGRASEVSCSGATSSASSTGPCPGRDRVPAGLWHTHVAKSRPHFPSLGTGCQTLHWEFAKSVSSSSLLGLLGQRGGFSVPQHPSTAPGRISPFPRAMQSQFIFTILLDLHWPKNDSQ